MKDKVLYLVIGTLVGAIVTTGVFMIINRNNSNQSQLIQSSGGNTVFTGNGQPPSQEELDAAQKTVLEDGTIRYDMPDGGVLMQRKTIQD